MSSMNTPQPSVEQPPIVAPVENSILMEWDAPLRPFTKRSKDYFTTVSTLAILIIVIFFFLKDFIIIFVILALVFLVYVFSTIAPESIHNSIYTTGIKSDNHFYMWQDLKFFRIDTKTEGTLLMVVQTRLRFPGQIFMLIDSSSRAQISEIMLRYLPLNENIENTWLDRASAWLSSIVPLDRK